MQLNDLPARRGDRPRTTNSAPHTQLSQNAPIEMQERLLEHALSLSGVRRAPSMVSVPGAVAFFLDRPDNEPALPDIFRGEWGHIHPADDGSLHLNLPTRVADKLIELGWGEYHYVVTEGLIPPIVIMLYGPRDEAELAVACAVVETAYVAAGGATQTDDGRMLAALHRETPSESVGRAASSSG
ncbi:MAG TPA: phospholipase [Microbacterium sp.]|nr:phospholipase [Microbacterium sp.]